MKNLAHLLSLILAIASTFTFAVHAQNSANYPSRPIKLVVPFPAGGPTDLLARVIGQKLSDKIGQPVIVENKAGANTIIGADAVAKAPADGYTLLVAIDNTLVMNQYLYNKLSYDPVKDFEPVAKLAVAPLVILTGAGGPSSMAALMARAKAQPGKVSYGYGTFTSQLGGELIKTSLGLDMLSVSYKGSAGTVQGLLSNDVTFIIDGVTAGLPHVQSGKFKAVGNLGKSKIPALPDLLPISNEQGLQTFDVAVWMGLVGPKGMPPAITQQLNAEINRILSMPDVKEQLSASGLIADPSSTKAFSTFLESESSKWKTVIDKAGIKVQ